MMGGAAAAATRYRITGPVAPPQAVAAGKTTLVFSDDFTTTTTIATSGAATSGFKWYWDSSGVTSTSDYSVNTTAVPGVFDGAPTAAGQSSGVLTISHCHNTFSAALTTVFRGQTANTPGCWNHGYVEAYIQFSSTVLGTGGPSAGWPAFWMWAIEGLGANVTAGQVTAETDIMEYFPAGTAGAGGTYIATMHNWLNSAGSATSADDFNTNNHHVGSTQPTDSGWHKYGMLWVGNGTTGTVQFYMDDTLQTLQGVSTFNLTAKNSDPTAGLSAMEADHMFIWLGTTGSGWPLNVDWVRIWQ